MASKKSIRIFDADSSVWRNIQSSVGLEFHHMTDLFDDTKHTKRNEPQFVWDDSAERARAERYVSYVKKLLKLCRKWSVIDGNKYPKLLDNNLGGTEFKGTNDEAVIKRAAYSLPPTGLKIIFELKKHYCRNASFTLTSYTEFECTAPSTLKSNGHIPRVTST
jgi:hypothetical protein